MTNTITTRQAADRLGITPRRVRQLIKAGLLAAVKIGRDWLIDSNSLDSLVKVQRGAGRPRLIKLEGDNSTSFPPDPGEVIKHLRKG